MRGSRDTPLYPHTLVSVSIVVCSSALVTSGIPNSNRQPAPKPHNRSRVSNQERQWAKIQRSFCKGRGNWQRKSDGSRLVTTCLSAGSPSPIRPDSNGPPTWVPSGTGSKARNQTARHEVSCQNCLPQISIELFQSCHSNSSRKTVFVWQQPCKHRDSDT